MREEEGMKRANGEKEEEEVEEDEEEEEEEEDGDVLEDISLIT